jgi:DNA-binding response OmpR family regulator
MDNRRILVLDDDPYVCSYVTDLLRHFGYDVDCAQTLEGAIRQLRSRPYDGLLVDYFMPGDNGMRLLAWLKQEERTEPAIMMSEMADYDLMIELVNKGAADLIPKPVQPGQLKYTLEMTLTADIHEARQALGAA